MLNSIVENELELLDIADFLTPEEMVAATNAWRSLDLLGGMAAFAVDSLGNLFVFSDTRSGESSVGVFDLDSTEVSLLANSFAEWIAEYCDVSEPS